MVCSLEGMSDEPYYLPVPRKGDYRFKVVNVITNEYKILNEVIDVIEEKNVDITWHQCAERKHYRKETDFNSLNHTDSTGTNKLKLFFKSNR